MEGILTHAATFEGRADSGESHLFTVEDATLEKAAVEALNLLAEDPPEPVPANAVPVEIEVISDDGTVRAPFRGSVDVVRILRRLTPPARMFAAASLSLYYRERACPEIADSVDALAADIASEDAGVADAAYRNLLTALLESPRLWAEHDTYRAFSLLRGAPLEHLQSMAGDPEPWVAGETLSQRILRIRSHFTTAEEYLEDVRALWGPFEVAVDQWVELGLSPQAAQVADRDTILNLIRTSLQADSGYARVIPFGMALGLAQLRPDLADVAIGEMKVEFIGAPALLRFDGSAGKLLAELLAEWLRNESDPPALEQFEENADRSPEAPSVRGIASVHALLDRMAVNVERYTYRAVLSEHHGAEATAIAAGTEEGDSIGDLLLLGHRLTSVLLAPVLRQVYELGPVVVIRDLEGAHEQDPLLQGRIPVREVFVPEVLGVGGQGVNPLLVLLLAFLCRLAQLRPGDDELGDSVPFWWTDEIRAELEVLAGREGPPQLRNLQNLAHGEGVSDRFGSLLTPGVEGHAAQLIALQDRAE